MNWQYILYNVDSGVAHVVLNHPEKLNALGMGPGSNRVELAEALEQADADPAVGAAWAKYLMLTGEIIDARRAAAIGLVLEVEEPDALLKHEGMGYAYLQKNRNKRSIVLDLKQAEHFAALEKLLQTADIFIYSVRPKAMAMARMGLTPERFAELNPGMISVSLVGYGEGGPYTGRPAYEDLIQGLTAIPSLLTRTGSAQPQYVPVSFNDRAVGVYAAAMMMIALNHRNRTGEGQHIEDSAPGQAPCSAPRREHRRGPDRARLLRRGVPQDRRRFIKQQAAQS